MSKWKWAALVLLVGFIIFFAVPHLWVLAPYLSDTPLEPVVKDVVRPPEVELWDVEIDDIGLWGLSLDLVLKVINPNSVPMRLDRADFEVYVDGNYLCSGSFPSTTVWGRSTEFVETHVEVPWKEGLTALWKVVRAEMLGGGLTLSVEGTAYVGGFPIPFSYSEVV